MVLENGEVEISNLSIEYVEFSHSIFQPRGKIKLITALDDINLKIRKGETVALIGKNGAGKSTLLKSICGGVRPSKGKIETSGRVILLAGTDPGFFPDSSGRKNVYELALAYGVEDENMQDFCDSVIEFAGLKDDIDRNVRGYSSGMKGKLGFGFITALDPDILLIDETLGVGDAEFRERAQNRLRDFVDRSGTVIISTHSFGLAKEICTTGIVLDSGSLHFRGDIEEVMSSYRELINS